MKIKTAPTNNTFTNTFVRLRTMLTKKVSFEDWVGFVYRAKKRLSNDELSLIDSYMANHNWIKTFPTRFHEILNVLSSEDFDNFRLDNPSAFDLLDKIWEAKRQHYQNSSSARWVLWMIDRDFDMMSRFCGVDTDSDDYSAEAELEKLFEIEHINKEFMILKSDAVGRDGDRIYRLFRR